MIHVIVPSYNCYHFLHRCLDSLEKQSLKDFRVVVIDDASTDQAHTDEMWLYVNRNEHWRAIRNETNMKAPYTIKQGIDASGAAPDDVIFLLDGDDFLPPGTLNYINQVYEQHPQFWMTYGSTHPEPMDESVHIGSEYPTLVRLGRDFRHHRVHRFNHPITFRRFLWDSLTDADLQDDDGRWFKGAYDFVIVIPMLEMAGPDHYAFLDEETYLYNTENEASDARIHLKEVVNATECVRVRPKKEQLNR